MKTCPPNTTIFKQKIENVKNSKNYIFLMVSNQNNI